MLHWQDNRALKHLSVISLLNSPYIYYTVLLKHYNINSMPCPFNLSLLSPTASFGPIMPTINNWLKSSENK